MSRMIPQRTVDVLRSFSDITVELYGINCELRIPLNLIKTERKDVYAEPNDYSYKPYLNQKVFIEWTPDIKRLHKLGVFTEQNLPIIAWLKNNPVVLIGSYLIVPIQYIPKQLSDTDEFDIIDEPIRGMHDAVAVHCYRLAPRRVKK